MFWNLFRTASNRTVVRRSSYRPRAELLEDRVVPTVLESGWVESNFANDSANLGGTTGLAWAPDGSNRLFVTRKGGQVRIIENGTLRSTPFATVSPIFTSSECGLIGITFDRDYVTNRFVYLFVTVSSGEQQIIRYTDSSNVGTNKTTIVAGLPTVGANHDGGAVGIGFDNKLYWAIGDQGNGTGVDANLSSLAAKVGRANLDGSVPTDNPFADGGGPNNDYVWARGFRNPFTFTFQERTGQLWVNDVGTSYEQIFKVNAGDHGGWNDFENNQPLAAPYITPSVVYRTNGFDTRSITAGGAVRSGGVATLTTSVAHGFRQGNKVTLAGIGDASFNGTDLDILSVPSPTTFTVARPGPNTSSGGGTAESGRIGGATMGGAITGGTFLESTAVPAQYRGNFFFGDFNSGRVFRVALDGSNNVASVNAFSSGISNIVDIAVGPDGALYYSSAGGNGIIQRTAYAPTAQGLIVTPTYLNFPEGGRMGFSVRLATAPGANVTVSVARTAGDADLSVFSGSTLTFTPNNFATPQAVVLAAAEDFDTANDTATFSISSAGLPTQTIDVRAFDNDTQALVLNTTAVSFNEGSTGTFTVRLQSAPTGNVTVNVARTAGDTDITVQSGATLTFTPGNFDTPQTVTLAAAHDADSSDDTATITVTTTGATPRTVAVTAIDDDTGAPVITSTPPTAAVVGATYTYNVNATGSPAPTYSLITAPSGMSINPTTGVITWAPASTGAVNVTVQASNGVPPAASQSWTITVAADQAPTVVLTQPTNGAVVSGANAEFFGDGFDDVGTVRAEFYVDGVLRSTDVNSTGHYHYGGEHLRWDTTQLSNGPHTLRFVVYDTAGQSGFTEVTVVVQNVQILDNGDAGFGTVGSWSYWTGFGYQGDVHQGTPGTAGDSATWAFPVSPGQYRVSATWAAHSNRASNAPFTALDGTSVLGTVRVDQRVAANDFTDQGVAWEDLGTFTVSGGTLGVRLGTDADGFLNADAIRIEKVGDLPQGPEVQVLDGAANIADGSGSVSFGSTPTGTAVTRTFTVRNVGTQDLTLGSISVPGGFSLASGFGTSTLTPGASTTFAVRLDAAAAGSFSGTVSFATNDADENPFNFTVSGTVTTPSTVQIVDNGDAGFGTVGSWSYWTGFGYQGDVHQGTAGTAGDSASWAFSVSPGQYRASATWAAHSNRASNAPFTVLDGTSALGTVRVDQRVAANDFTDQGVAWEDLGTFTVSGGTLGVRLGTDADGFLNADAIRIEKIGDLPQGPEVQVLDGAANIADGSGSVSFGSTPTGTAVTRTFTVRNVGTQDLMLGSISVPGGFSLASGFGTSTLTPGASTTFTVRLDATVAGSFSGTVSFATNDADENPFNFTVAGTVQNVQILDNGDAGFGTVGSWSYWTGQGFQADVHQASPGTGSDTATWTFTVSPGRYRVSASWSVHPNRATNAPFTVYNGGTALSTVRFNQELTPNDRTDQGVGWEDLGIFSITGNTLVVTLTNDANEYVIADAVRIERIGDL